MPASLTCQKTLGNFCSGRVFVCDLNEIGCGTGRVAIPLASAAFDINGLDVSSSMLEEARRKAEDQGLGVSWIQADGVTFDLDRRFALIIMPF